jgi:hypothetical protein
MCNNSGPIMLHRCTSRGLARQGAPSDEDDLSRVCVRRYLRLLLPVAAPLPTGQGHDRGLQGRSVHPLACVHCDVLVSCPHSLQPLSPVAAACSPPNPSPTGQGADEVAAGMLDLLGDAAFEQVGALLERR